MASNSSKKSTQGAAAEALLNYAIASVRRHAVIVTATLTTQVQWLSSVQCNSSALALCMLLACMVCDDCIQRPQHFGGKHRFRHNTMQADESATSGCEEQ